MTNADGPMAADSEDQIFAEYLPKLIRLAGRNLSAKLRRKVDADDLSATVMRTVIRRVRSGSLELEQSDNFWKLLTVITLNKARKKARYWTAKKRDIGRESELSDDGPTLSDFAECKEQLQSEPTEEDGEACGQLLAQLMDRLDEKCLTVLDGKLDGLSTTRIAEQMNVSPRSVRRYIEKIEEELKSLGQSNAE